MSLHYLDPDREPRECPICSGRGSKFPDVAHDKSHPKATRTEDRCPICNGTGRLGAEGAQPDVEVDEEPASELTGADRWYYTINPHARPIAQSRGPFPTEAAALEAARKSVSR